MAELLKSSKGRLENVREEKGEGLDSCNCSAPGVSRSSVVEQEAHVGDRHTLALEVLQRVYSRSLYRGMHRVPTRVSAPSSLILSKFLFVFV